MLSYLLDQIQGPYESIYTMIKCEYLLSILNFFFVASSRLVVSRPLSPIAFQLHNHLEFLICGLQIGILYHLQQRWLVAFLFPS